MAGKIGQIIEREGLRLRVVGRWQYETIDPVPFETIAGLVCIKPGYHFYTGTEGLALPPGQTAGFRATLLHDYLYCIWRNRDGGVAHADVSMITEMKRNGAGWFRCEIVAIVIRLHRRFWLRR